MTSETRLQMIFDHGCTLLCCTPTYALHLAGVAASSGLNLASGPVTRIIVAGEPGGSLPVVRQRIEQAWGATVIDHSGASEIGAWGVGSHDGRGLLLDGDDNVHLATAGTFTRHDPFTVALWLKLPAVKREVVE